MNQTVSDYRFKFSVITYLMLFYDLSNNAFVVMTMQK